MLDLVVIPVYLGDVLVLRFDKDGSIADCTIRAVMKESFIFVFPAKDCLASRNIGVGMRAFKRDQKSAPS